MTKHICVMFKRNVHCIVSQNIRSQWKQISHWGKCKSL